MDAWETCVSLLPIGKKELACLLYCFMVSYVARVFIVHSIEIPINRVVFIFCVLIIGAVSLGQRYTVDSASTFM